jgi:CheY-like chemotaxis protein
LVVIALFLTGRDQGTGYARKKPSRSAIKVLLADNHTMFREGLASVLADYGGIEVVGQTDNDEGAVELARLRKPDVIPTSS